MKKRMTAILALMMLTVCVAAAAEGGSTGTSFAALTGLKEAQEKVASGMKIGGANYSEGDRIEINDPESVNILWDAISALGTGEKTEAPAGGIPARLAFWFRDDTLFELFFEGTALKTAGGEYYTLRNDEPLRKALNELTDRSRLTLDIDGRACILGKSTPQDLMNAGLDSYITEEDGTIGFTQDDGESWLYVRTEHGKLNEPILTVNAFWSGIPTGYCGFDGICSVGWLDDPDAVWNPDGYTVDERDMLIADGEMSAWNHWEGLGIWLTERYGAKVSDEGIMEARIPLSDGRTVYVSTNGTPVRISLLPE